MPFLTAAHRGAPRLFSCLDLRADADDTLRTALMSSSSHGSVLSRSTYSQSLSTSTTTSTTTTASTSTSAAAAAAAASPPLTESQAHPLVDLDISPKKQPRFIAARPPSPGSPPPSSSASDSSTPGASVALAPSISISMEGAASSSSLPKAQSEPTIKLSSMSSASSAAPIMSPFSGTFVNELYCNKEQASRVQVESFLDISLTIPRVRMARMTVVGLSSSSPRGAFARACFLENS